MPTTTTSYENIASKIPEQTSLLQTILSQLSPELLQQLMGDQEQFLQNFQKGVADPAIRNFNEQIIPELQNIFAGSGSKGGTSQSSQLVGAGQRLSSDLASMLAQAQQQEVQNQRGFATNLSQLGLGTDTFQTVGTQTTKTNPMEMLLQSLGIGVGGALAGPAVAGVNKGVNAIAKLFGLE